MWNCTEGGERLEKSGVLRPRSLEFDPSESFRSSCMSLGDEGTPVGEAAPSEGMAAAPPPPLLLPPLRCICSKARFWEGTGTGSVRGPLGTLCLGGGGSGCCCTGKYEGRGEPSWLPGDTAPPEAIFLAGVLPESSPDQRGAPPAAAAASALGWSSPIEAGTMTKSWSSGEEEDEELLTATAAACWVAPEPPRSSPHQPWGEGGSCPDRGEPQPAAGGATAPPPPPPTPTASGGDTDRLEGTGMGEPAPPTLGIREWSRHYKWVMSQ